MTLRDLRISAGLSLAQVAGEVSRATGREYKDRAAHMWEIRGTNQGKISLALANLYGKSREEIEEAIAQSAAGNAPALRPGRPKRIIA